MVNLPTIKDILDIAQSLSIILASITAGIWALWLFKARRQSHPRAKIKHKISHRTIINGKVLLSIVVTISNIGEVLIQLEKSQIRVSQVLPPKDELLDRLDPKASFTLDEKKSSITLWPEIGYWPDDWNHKIEPGESRQVSAHFVIEPDVEIVLIYSHITNVKESNPNLDLGWELETLYDLQTAKNALSPNVVQSSNGAQSSWLRKWLRP